jgi:hypothetical protein
MSEAPKRLSRRTLFAGASTVGALAAAASVVPGVAPTAGPVVLTPKVMPERGGGYSLSDHVKRYYGTARV